jgi:hypothetical protein
LFLSQSHRQQAATTVSRRRNQYSGTTVMLISGTADRIHIGLHLGLSFAQHGIVAINAAEGVEAAPFMLIAGSRRNSLALGYYARTFRRVGDSSTSFVLDYHN